MLKQKGDAPWSIAFLHKNDGIDCPICGTSILYDRHHSYLPMIMKIIYRVAVNVVSQVSKTTLSITFFKSLS